MFRPRFVNSALPPAGTSTRLIGRNVRLASRARTGVCAPYICYKHTVRGTMDFGVRFAFHLLFLACFDTCWLTLNFGLLRGCIYPETAKSKKHFCITVVFCFLCWIASALYLAGHRRDTISESAIEGAWIGSLVYAVFNFTTFIVNADWPVLPTAIVDTLWGTGLFSLSSVLTTIIADAYFATN